MSRPVHPEPLTRVRDDARMLVDRTAYHESQLEALVAVAETEMKDAEALSRQMDRTELCGEQLRSTLDAVPATVQHVASL